MSITVHIGYGDHISGFELTRRDLLFIALLPHLGAVNDYILEHCQRIETNEADLFIDMMDEDYNEFRYNVREVLEYHG